MSTTELLAIEEWRPDREHVATLESDVEALADVLRAVVYDGAGVSFIVPFSMDDARAFWLTGVVPGVKARTRRVLNARRDGRDRRHRAESTWPRRRTSVTAPRS